MCALFVCECNGCDLGLFLIHCVVLYYVFVRCECDCAKPPTLNACLCAVCDVLCVVVCVCGLCICVCVEM